MESMKQFEQYFTDNRQRKIELQDKRAVLAQQIRQLESDFEKAFIDNAGHEDIQKKIDAANAELAGIDKKISILDRAGDGGPTIEKLAAAVVSEGQTIAAELSDQVKNQAQVCIELRDKYLQEVGKLGELERQGTSLSYRCSLASKYLPGPKVHVGVNSQWPAVKVDGGLCERAYKNQ